MELTVVGVETHGHTQGYNNPPVLRRLVGESHIPPGLSPAYTRSSENMPKIRLPVRPHGRSGLTYTGPLAEPSGQILEILSLPVCPVQQFMSDRFTNSHRKAISPRPTSQETHTVASQKQLEGTRVTRKGDSNTKVLHPHLQGWLQEDNVLTGQPLHPNET